MTPVSPSGSNERRPAQCSWAGRSRGRGAGVIGIRPVSPAWTQWPVDFWAIRGVRIWSIASAFSIRSRPLMKPGVVIRSMRSMAWQNEAHCAGVRQVMPTKPSVVG